MLFRRVNCQEFFFYIEKGPQPYCHMLFNMNQLEIPSLSIVEDRELLGNYGEFLPVHPGQTVIFGGKPQNSLYFVISGVLHVHTEVDKRTAGQSGIDFQGHPALTLIKSWPAGKEASSVAANRLKCSAFSFSF